MQENRRHLLDGFITEVSEYIPVLQHSLAQLHGNLLDKVHLEQCFRLFHNIKGAASQLGLEHLSASASIVEELLESALLADIELNYEMIHFLEITVGRIKMLCVDNVTDDQKGLELLDYTQEGAQSIRKSLLSNDPLLTEEDLFSVDSEAILLSEEDGENQDSELIEVADDSLFKIDSEIGIAGKEIPVDLEDTLTSTDDDLFQVDSELILEEEKDTIDVSQMAELNSGFGEEFTPQSGLQTPDSEPSIEESAIEDESDEEQSLHEIFLAECEEHLLVISKALIELENQIDEEITCKGSVAQVVAEMRRAVHTLKGAAGMTGFMQLSELAHSCEDLLDGFVESSSVIYKSDVLVLAKAIDIIELISLNPTDIDVAQVEEITTQLKKTTDSRNEEKKKKSENDKPVSLVSDDVNSTQITSSKTLQDVAIIDEEIKFANENLAEPPFSPGLPSEKANVRVKLESLDELVSQEGELLIARNRIEQGFSDISQTIAELNLAKNKLRRISNELERGFEVESLYGFGQQQLRGVNVPAKGGQQNTQYTDFDPIELDRYSQLSLIIRSLNELGVDIGSIHSEMSGIANEIKAHMAQQQFLMRVMQDKLMRIRMTPMSTISHGFFRTVRDAATQLGKKVQLKIEGDDVYLDRYIWSKVVDPIMHILRNAVDHGIEFSAERQKSGKPLQATIRFKASQKGNHVVLQISDDGMGINADLIRETLVKRQGLDDTSQLTDNQLFDYLFIPGFTTSKEISRISGRGVGLDVVRKNIEELRGTVKIESQWKHGTTFHLRIPLTLSMNKAVIVDLGPEKYAVPLSEILEIRKVPITDLIFGEKPFVNIGEIRLPLQDLGNLVELPSLELKNSGREDAVILVVAGRDSETALLVQNIDSQQEIIVKNLGSHLQHVSGISGATIVGDGSLIPILNLGELVSQERRENLASAVVSPEPVNRSAKVMIVDDSVSVRQSVSRLIKGMGWQPMLANDGVDAVEKLEEYDPDIIILDIEMPRMNGFEFMAVLRNNKRYLSIPVIMLTSRVSEKHQKKAIELGVNQYVFKPYQQDSFEALLKKTLDIEEQLAAA